VLCCLHTFSIVSALCQKAWPVTPCHPSSSTDIPFKTPSWTNSPASPMADYCQNEPERVIEECDPTHHFPRSQCRIISNWCWVGTGGTAAFSYLQACSTAWLPYGLASRGAPMAQQSALQPPEEPLSPLSPHLPQPG
jgi:hypothetical protein